MSKVDIESNVRTISPTEGYGELDRVCELKFL